MYLDLNKSTGPVTGKWCIRKERILWSVYDGFGVWWGVFETHADALGYVTSYEERWDEWQTKLL